MPVSSDDLRGILYTACESARTQGISLFDVLATMRRGAYGSLLDGQGAYPISSTSSAGHSVTLDTGNGAVSGSDAGKAATRLTQLANQCIADNPALADDPEGLCACIDSKIPVSPVRTFGARYCGMAYSRL